MILHKTLLGAGAELWLPFALSKLRDMAQRFGPHRFFSERYLIEGFSVEVKQAPPFQYVSIRDFSCPEAVFLPAGADMWANATEIPLTEYADAFTLPTYNKNFTRELPRDNYGYKTAWWKVFVPNGRTFYFSIDTRLTFGAEVDTRFSYYWMPAGGSTVDDLTSEDSNDDAMFIYGYGQYWSRYDDGLMVGSWSGNPAGTWFYLNIADRGPSQSGSALVMTFSLSESIRGAVPDDGHDPDVPQAVPTPAATRCFTIAAGADNFADATEISYGERRWTRSAYTYNDAMTTEGGEPVIGINPPGRTAWWKFRVPAGTICYPGGDTKYSFGAQVNTSMAIYKLPSGGGIADLVWIADGLDAEGDYLLGNWSRLGEVDEVICDGDYSGDAEGTWFYIQVGDNVIDGARPYTAYVLRLTLTELAHGTIPVGAEDPA